VVITLNNIGSEVDACGKLSLSHKPYIFLFFSVFIIQFAIFHSFILVFRDLLGQILVANLR
jgi:hypothetical protein